MVTTKHSTKQTINKFEYNFDPFRANDWDFLAGFVFVKTEAAIDCESFFSLSQGSNSMLFDALPSKVEIYYITSLER